MKKEARGMTAILIVYSLLMLSIMGITVFILSKRTVGDATHSQKEEEPTEKYVYIYADPNESTADDTTVEETWVVKEYEKRIGIFSEEGQLLELLEIYTNTLPKADQGLLREGITVTKRSELYALIEDYSE